LHQRLGNQQGAECAAVAGVVQGLHQRLTHHAGAAENAIQARVRAHFEDGRNPAAFFAHQMRPRVDEFDFRGGVGAIAELVLQALDVDSVARAVGQPARHEQAGQSALGLGEHQVRVALRR
jgi:hypothetical protein